MRFQIRFLDYFSLAVVLLNGECFHPLLINPRICACSCHCRVYDLGFKHCSLRWNGVRVLVGGEFDPLDAVNSDLGNV